MTNKAFAVLDSAIIPLVTQPMQHALFQQYSKQKTLELIFYLTEDRLTIDKLATLAFTVKESNEIKNLIFLRLGQLLGEKKLGRPYLLDLLKDGYRLFFVREQLEFCSVQDYLQMQIELSIFEHSDAKIQLKIERAILETFPK